MVKDAVISIRVEPSLKAHLEETAQRRGMTLASYVDYENPRRRTCARRNGF